MRYAVQCERCKRPADTREQTKYDKGTHVQIDTKKVKTCACGGKIIVALE